MRRGGGPRARLEAMVDRRGRRQLALSVPAAGAELLNLFGAAMAEADQLLPCGAAAGGADQLQPRGAVEREARQL